MRDACARPGVEGLRTPEDRMRQLTQNQQALYDFILEHVERAGYQPSVREMADHFDVAINAVKGRLQFLACKGLIRFTGKYRGLELRGLRFLRVSSCPESQRNEQPASVLQPS